MQVIFKILLSLKKTYLKEPLSGWLLPSNLTWFAFMLKSHCIVIISISNDIMQIYWTLARVELSLLAILSLAETVSL